MLSGQGKDGTGRTITGGVDVLKFFEKQRLSSVALETGDEAGVPSLSKCVGMEFGPPIETVNNLPKVLKEHHYIISDQDVLHEHDDKVFSYMSRLRQLLEGSEPAAAPPLMTEPLQHLHRQMRQVDRESEKIKEDVAGLEAETSVDQFLYYDSSRSALMASCLSSPMSIVASCFWITAVKSFSKRDLPSRRFFMTWI